MLTTLQSLLLSFYPSLFLFLPHCLSISLPLSFSQYISLFRYPLSSFLIKYLGTHGGEIYPPDVQQLATTAVLSAIKSPVSSFSDRNALLEVSASLVRDQDRDSDRQVVVSYVMGDANGWLIFNIIFIS